MALPVHINALNTMKKTFIFLFILVMGMSLYAQDEVQFTVQKIWDNGTYNAFTSLVKFKGRYYCAFREGRGHVFDEHGKAEGKIRVLSSRNGKKWKSVHLVGEPGKDYRDPKLSVTPDGRLSLSIGVSVYVDKKFVTQSPYVSFSTDGVNYTKPQTCSVEGSDAHTYDWVWRTTWHEDIGYAVDYFTRKDGTQGLSLLKTTDAIHYSLMTELEVPNFPNEATIRFLSDGRMAIMVRRDGGDCMGYWAVSPAPYTQWEWKRMPMRLGGPDFLMLSDDKVVATSRCHHIPGWATTSVYTGDARTGKFRQRIVLPSGGDTSYCGMIIEDGELWVSYYSGHATHWPSIYLARIPLESLE